MRSNCSQPCDSSDRRPPHRCRPVRLCDVLALARLSARSEIAAVRFRQAQLRAAEETLRIAAETRRSYYGAVASRELVRFLEQAKSAADTAAQLTVRLGETGSMNKLDQA